MGFFGIPSVAIELIIDTVVVLIVWIIVAQHLYRKFASD